MFRTARVSSVYLAIALAAAPVALAQQARGTVSKDDIINALAPPDPGAAGTRGFGFRQSPTTPKPKTSERTSYQKGDSAPAAAEHPSVGVAILFDFNSAEIKPESKSQLTDIAQALQSDKLKTDKILVEGHTDATGSPAANLALSKARAAAVRDFLVAEGGVPTDRLTTVGKGQSDPVNKENPMAPENRRVVLVNLSR